MMKIKTIHPKLINRLSIRIILPVIFSILIAGFTLYFSVYKISTDFIENLVKENFEEMSRDIYKIIDKNIDELLRQGLIDDEKSVRIRKGLTIGVVEDFIKENNLECLITEKNKVIFSTLQLPAKPETITEKIKSENLLYFTKLNGAKYYSYKLTFEPWDWKIIILKNQTKYSVLIDKVKFTYLLTGAVLLTLMFFLILFLNSAIKSPVNKIIKDIQKGKKPEYKGIYEFEFLSSSVSNMIERLLNQNKYLAALNETTLDLISRLELNDLLIAIITRAGAIAGTPHGFIYLLEPEGTELKLQIGTGFFAQMIGMKIKTKEGLSGRVMENNSPMVVDDYHIWEGKITSEKNLEALRAMVGVPLKSGNETVGVIGLAHLEDNEKLTFDENKVEVLKRFAELASIAYDNARLYTALQQELAERKKAENSLREINQSTQALIVSSPIAIFAVDRECNVTMWNPAAEKIFGWKAEEVMGDINPIAPYDEMEKFHFWRDKISKGESAKDVELKCRKKDRTTIEASLSLAPLFDSHNEIIGIMSLAEDISKQKKRERELEVIVTVSAALREAQNTSEMYPIILDQILSVLKADGTALAMRDNKSGDLIVELAKGTCSHATGEIINVSEELNKLIISGKPSLFNNIKDDPSFAKLHAECELTAYAYVPLIAHGQTIGMLWAGRKTEITKQELHLLTVIGDITANAINRAGLHEQTGRRMSQLTALHSIDMAITSSMSLDITLDVLINQILTQLKVDAGDILLFDPFSLSLKYAAGRGILSNEHREMLLRLGEDYAGIAAAGRRNIFINNLRETAIVHRYSKLLISEGFVSYFCIPLITKGEIKGVLELFHRTELSPDREWKDFLNSLAVQTAIAIDSANLFSQLQNSNAELQMAYDSTIEAWSRILDLRHNETEGHSIRVTEMTLFLARKMGMYENELIHVRRGALLHDIGKMGIPDSILLKPDSLDEEEMKIMQFHPVYAFEMLSPIKYLNPALNIPYCHHEKWDGTGYPRGLKEEQIPLEARIFAVVDVWDALKSDRIYRRGWAEEKIKAHMRKLAGAHFDPKVIKVFFEIMEWENSNFDQHFSKPR